MPIFTARPGAPATDPNRVAAYLQSKGYVLADGVSLFGDGSVSVACDRDPTVDLAAYTDAPTPEQAAVARAVTFLRGYATTTAAIPAAQRTPEQNALTAILIVLKAALTP